MSRVSDSRFLLRFSAQANEAYHNSSGSVGWSQTCLGMVKHSAGHAGRCIDQTRTQTASMTACVAQSKIAFIFYPYCELCLSAMPCPFRRMWCQMKVPWQSSLDFRRMV